MIKIKDNEIPVNIEDPPKDTKEVEESKIFQDWTQSLDPSFDVKSISLQSVDKFGARMGFIKIKTETYRNNVRIPGIVLLRGGAVGMLIEISDEQTNEKYSILTHQPRLPTGKILYEIPAGMLDGSGNIKGFAIKELEEECGLKCEEKDLIDLTNLAYGNDYMGIYSNSGLLDEYLKLFLWRTTMNHERIEEINGKIGGVDEHEQICLKIVKYDDIWKFCPDGKTLSALYLKNILEKEGKI